MKRIEYWMTNGGVVGVNGKKTEREVQRWWDREREREEVEKVRNRGRHSDRFINNSKFNFKWTFSHSNLLIYY